LSSLSSWARSVVTSSRGSGHWLSLSQIEKMNCSAPGNPCATCKVFSCPSGWVLDPRMLESLTLTKERCCKEVVLPPDECKPTCEWQCTNPRCEQNCTVQCEDVACPDPKCTPQECKTKCDAAKPNCQWEVDGEMCAKTNCGYAKLKCSKPQCEMECPPPICEKSECNKKCGWNCKVPEGGCDKPQCHLVCEAPKKCTDRNKPKTPTCDPDADPQGAIIENYTCSPPAPPVAGPKHPQVGPNKTIPPAVTDSCKPSCGWECDRSRKYHQDCKKKCSKEAKCDVRCEETPLDACTIVCGDTKAEAPIENIPNCPMKDCPTVTEVRTADGCKQICPPPKCVTFCEEAVCEWQCELPAGNYTEPQCDMVCNEPKAGCK